MNQYISTRGGAAPVSASQAVLAGIAPDGGLFVPQEIPALDLDALRGKSFSEVAQAVCRALLPDFTEAEIAECVTQGYAGKFEGDEVAPVVKVGDRYVLELYHGPTCAFKDVALSLLPRFMSVARRKNGVAEEIVILAATSGDTGSAAIEGFKNVPGTRIIVFYPETGISDVQRAQMVTVDAANVRACAVKGNFDDAQAGVKRIFTHVTPDMLSTPEHGARLSSANSINIGRLVPQVAYYVSCYLTLVEFGEIAMGDKLNFSVPTGNFGDILAGYIAGRMGLPVGRLICASNANDVLTEFFHTGTYNRVRPFHVTASPSMDILVSSNLERLLYFMSDAETTAGLMKQLNETGAYTLSGEMFRQIREQFPAGSCDDAATLATIGDVFRDYGYLMDPHTAVAWRVAEQQPADGNRTVVLSTASPFKFAANVLKAVGEAGEGDGFDQLRHLEACTGWKAPDALAKLEGKPAVQRDAREPQMLDDYVVERVREAKW